MKRSAFTLIELLVVIAVIIMLIGILLPVLRLSRRQARALTCRSNVKQLALVLTIYEQENGSFPHGFVDLTKCLTPPPGNYLGNAAFDDIGWWWFHFLAGTIGDEFRRQTILECPSRCVRGYGVGNNVLCGNYGVNQAICTNTLESEDSIFAGLPLTINQISHPAATLLVTDSGYSLISWKAATKAADDIFTNASRVGCFYLPGLAINKERALEGTISPSSQQDAIEGRHPRRSINVAFADGHAARLKVNDLLVEEMDGDYKNRFPLWLPK